jgi:hypothetical protein
MEAGVSEHDLPGTERLCREIRKLDPDQQPVVWRAVHNAAKNKGRKPQVSDVQEAAVEIIQSPSVIERQQAELLHSVEGAARKLKIGLAVNLLTPAFKHKLIGVLLQISEAVQCMITTLKSPAVKEHPKTEDRKTKPVDQPLTEEPADGTP